MTYLLIGGAGFIGRSTARLLRDCGHEVIILDCFDRSVHMEALEPIPYPELAGTEVIHRDARDVSTLTLLLERSTAVLLLASLTATSESMSAPMRYYSVNLGITAALCEALAVARRKPQRVVLASSRAVYGEGRSICPTHGVVIPYPRNPEDLANAIFDASCPVCGVFDVLSGFIHEQY